MSDTSGAVSAGGIGQTLAAGSVPFIGQGISAGINAAAASKAHDRSKNFATRKYLYELIALKEAGINPAYMFADHAKGAGAGQSQRAAQAAGTGIPSTNASGAMMVPAQIRNLEAQTNSAEQLAKLHFATAEKTRAETGRIPHAGELDVQKSKEIEMKLNRFRENPKLLENILKQQGTPPTNAAAIMRGVGEIIKGLKSGGEMSEEGQGALVIGGSILAYPFVKALLAKDWSSVQKIGFQFANKQGMSKAVFTKQFIPVLGKMLGLSAAAIVAWQAYNYSQNPPKGTPKFIPPRRIN